MAEIQIKHRKCPHCRGEVDGPDTVARVDDPEQMLALLHSYFPVSGPNDLNFVLFSTSGITGSYMRLDDAWAAYRGPGKVACGECEGKGLAEHTEPGYGQGTLMKCAQCGGSGVVDGVPTVTVVIVKSRVHQMVHGECAIPSEAEYMFLRKLREDSWNAVRTIGAGP